MIVLWWLCQERLIFLIDLNWYGIAINRDMRTFPYFSLLIRDRHKTPFASIYPIFPSSCFWRTFWSLAPSEACSISLKFVSSTPFWLSWQSWHIWWVKTVFYCQIAVGTHATRAFFSTHFSYRWSAGLESYFHGHILLYISLWWDSNLFERESMWNL